MEKILEDILKLDDEIVDDFWKEQFKTFGVNHVYAIPKKEYKICCFELGLMLQACGHAHCFVRYKYQNLLNIANDEMEYQRFVNLIRR